MRRVRIVAKRIRYYLNKVLRLSQTHLMARMSCDGRPSAFDLYANLLTNFMFGLTASKHWSQCGEVFRRPASSNFCDERGPLRQWLQHGEGIHAGTPIPLDAYRYPQVLSDATCWVARVDLGNQISPAAAWFLPPLLGIWLELLPMVFHSCPIS
jgi:hypothetical protein